MSDPVQSVQPEPTPFEKMTALAKRVISVPKKDVDEREKIWKESKVKKKSS